ncbi:hypothetical protein V6Z92_008329 [Aspergillus fumigatus]
MSLPPIATATLQAALVNAGSNVLAQGIRAWRDEGLESRFPGSSEDTSVTQSTAEKHGSKQGKQKLNVKNIVAKVVIDQTIGGAINTVVFVMTMGLLRGQDFEVVKAQIQNDFWPIMFAGFKLWPFVSILNFTVVPADKRLLVGSLFGVIWAVYLSLMSG